MLAFLIPLLLGTPPAAAVDEPARTLALLRESRAQSSEATWIPGRQPPPSLLESYAERCGWELEIAPDAADSARDLELGVLGFAAATVPDVCAFVQNLVRLRGCCLRLECGAARPRLVLERAASARAFDAPLEIPLDALSGWTDFPGFVIALEIPHARAGSEELAQRLRSWFPEGSRRTDVTALGSGALRLVGSPLTLEFLVETLRDSDGLAVPIGSALSFLDPAALRPDLALSACPALCLGFPKRPPGFDPSGCFVTSRGTMLQAYVEWSARTVVETVRHPSELHAHGPSQKMWKQLGERGDPHEFTSGWLAGDGLTLAAIPPLAPVLWSIEERSAAGSLAVDVAGVPTIHLRHLLRFARLPATVLQTFVVVPDPDPELRERIAGLHAEARGRPFRITELDQPGVFSVMGDAHAIADAVLAMRLALTPPKPR